MKKSLLIYVILYLPFYSFAQLTKSDTYSREELIKLNQAYIKVLKEHRSKTAGVELVFKLDTTTMYTAQTFANQLHEEGRIGHPSESVLKKIGVAEICQSMSIDAIKYYKQRNYEALERYAYMVFSLSPSHAKIQRSGQLYYIGVGCNAHAFVVRLRESPMPKKLAEGDRRNLIYLLN